MKLKFSVAKKERKKIKIQTREKVKNFRSKAQKKNEIIYNLKFKNEYDFGFPEVDKFLDSLKKEDVQILETNQNLFSDTLKFTTKNKKIIEKLKKNSIVNSVLPEYYRKIPEPKNMEKPTTNKKGFFEKINEIETYFPDLGKNECTNLQSDVQAAIIDTIKTEKKNVENKGVNSIIVIWDFLPANDSDLNKKEFTERSGGLNVIRSEDSALDTHGSAVASICGGKYSGLATGSDIYLLGLTNNVENDLNIIDNLCKSTQKPVIVNMSFALQWEQVVLSEMQEIRNYINSLNEICKEMKNRHKQLLFVVAAGNEGLNVCETTSPVSYSGCNSCVFWPQFQFGEDYEINKIPFVFVGSTEISSTSPYRKLSNYSNFGGCVHTYINGGNICAINSETGKYDGIQGTSFSSPIFSSAAALAFASSNNSKSADEVVTYLLQNSENDITGLPSNSNNKYTIIPDNLYASNEFDDKDEEIVIDTGTTIVENTNESSIKKENEKESNYNFIVLIVVLILLIIFYFIYSQNKK